MDEHKYIASDINLMRSFLQEEKWNTDPKLPDGWLIKRNSKVRKGSRS